MTTQTLQPTQSAVEKFHNAEQMWFWFVYSKAVRGGMAHSRTAPTRRICELLDVETLITKLYLAGRLSDEQLRVLKDFGDRRRAPHQYIWAENRAADLWRRAMETIGDAARARGWVEE